MRKIYFILTGFLLFAFLVQTFHQASIIADYYVNTASYAQNCENKAKPQLHCNGKCQMMRKLKQASKKDQQNPERNENVKKQVLSSKSFFAIVQGISIENQLFHNEYYFQMTSNNLDAIFHPPGSLFV